MDPQPDTGDFEPTYFPSVEFDRPDFPWLFTPASAGPDAKLRPWLCLVVVRKQDGVTLGSHRRRAVAGAADRRAGASEHRAARPARKLGLGARPGGVGRQHAAERARRAGRLARAGAVSADLSAHPAAETDYIACVVPTFELGRKAGLGLAIDRCRSDRRQGARAGVVAIARAGAGDAAGLLPLGVPYRRGRRLRVAGSRLHRIRLRPAWARARSTSASRLRVAAEARDCRPSEVEGALQPSPPPDAPARCRTGRTARSLSRTRWPRSSTRRGTADRPTRRLTRCSRHRCTAAGTPRVRRSRAPARTGSIS